MRALVVHGALVDSVGLVGLKTAAWHVYADTASQPEVGTCRSNVGKR